MTEIIEITPNYEPKINEDNTEKIDLNIRDLQIKYPNGCLCCGTIYYPRKFSSMISSHFNTQKHKKKCLYPANQLFKEEFGASNNLKDAFENKCKESREEKKLLHEYRNELKKLKITNESLLQLNIELQKKITNLEKKNHIKCENLIDLL